MPAPTHPSNLQRRIHAGGGRVLEQRKSIGVRIHTTPQVGADGKPAEAPHRRAHGDDYPLELRSGLTNRLMTIGTCYWVDLHKGADAGLTVHSAEQLRTPPLCYMVTGAPNRPDPFAPQ